jgi:eukaryotic-like serine/threonine-protein kinase
MAEETRLEELLALWEQRRQRGEEPALAELCRDCPELAPKLRERIRARTQLDRLNETPDLPPASPDPQPNAPEPPPDTPRYRFVAFLARGGMGEVWRGQDRVLSREVAIKVLRRRLGSTAAARQFREEAALVARLQHPAVVPVYDCGALQDGRPFFVMKLVGGRTLAELLRQWPGSPETWPHYGQLFGQVCQAVAFAHAHSPPVLHRDLKPSNVMVGDFGEVQVMDWGIAKVLAKAPASQSPAALAHAGPEAVSDATSETTDPYRGHGHATNTGEVKGTPQFMAPEQARGERAAIGPAADVFGLGGILCVMLTGKPPFRDLEKATAGDLTETFARLEGCGADGELIALAKSCLAPDPGRRPADAGAVARAVLAYQAGVQERLRKAELERAAAEVEARAERKRRRLQRSLLGALLVLVLGAGGVLWGTYEKRREADQAARAARTSVRQALQQARANPMKDFGKYDEALANAQAAVELARNGTEAARREAAEVLQAVRREAEAAARTRELLNAWLNVYQPRETATYQRGEGGRMVALALPSAEEQFGAALKRWGLDIDRVSVEEAAAQFKDLPEAVVQELVAGLDQWAEERQRAKPRQGDWRKLAGVADRLDGNALRREVRGSRLGGESQDAHSKQRTRLRALARKVDPSAEPVLTVASLARALQVVGEGRAAESLLRSALVSRPGEIVLLNALSRLLTEQRPPRYAEAIEYYRAARAVRPELGIRLGKTLLDANRASEAEELLKELVRLRPDNPELHFYLGYTQGTQGKLQEAAAAYGQALRLKTDYPLAHTNLGFALLGQGRHQEAEAACRQAIKLRPHFYAAHTNLGLALAGQGRYKEAEAAYRQALKLQPDYHQAHTNLGAALLGQGRPKEAEAAFRQALQFKPDDPKAHNNLGAALLGQGRPKEAEAAFRQAIKFKPDFPGAHFNLGYALWRQGRHQQAGAAYRRAFQLKPDFPEALCNLGDTLLQQGQYEEAERAFRQVLKLKPDFLEAQNNLGIALFEQGRPREAERAFRQALRLKPDYPLAKTSLRLLQRHREQAKQLPAILRGAAKPRNLEELLEFALVCATYEQRHLAAVQLYGRAFDAAPVLPHDLRAEHRYRAARVAALAATSRGKDTAQLSVEEAIWLSQRSRAWLRADLDAYARLLARDGAKAASTLRGRLEHWQACDDLAGVRAPGALAVFPEDERRAWLALWADVDALRRQLLTYD